MLYNYCPVIAKMDAGVRIYDSDLERAVHWVATLCLFAGFCVTFSVIKRTEGSFVLARGVQKKN